MTTTKEYLEEYGDGLENYFYTDHGQLVYLEEKLTDTRFLVAEAFHYCHTDYDDGYRDEGISYGTPFIYSGKLHSAEGYEKNVLQHDSLTNLQKAMTAIKEEIINLQAEKRVLQQWKSLNKQEIEDSKTFMAAYNLMSNTKRFILIRDSKWSAFIVDNLDKKWIGKSDDDDDNYDSRYYRESNRYKDIEFTFYRDFSRYSNPKEKLFNFNIRLNKDRKDESWRDDWYNYTNQTFDADIVFGDTFEDFQDTLDGWAKSGELNLDRYLNIIQNCALKIHPEIGTILKERLLQSANGKKANSLSSAAAQVEEAEKAAVLVQEIEQVDPSNIDELKKFMSSRGLHV